MRAFITPRRRDPFIVRRKQRRDVETQSRMLINFKCVIGNDCTHNKNTFRLFVMEILCALVACFVVDGNLFRVNNEWQELALNGAQKSGKCL